MNIALIAPLAFPIREPFAGGLEMQVSGLCDALVERGHDVTLFAAQGSECSARVVSPTTLMLCEGERAAYSDEGGCLDQAQEFHHYVEIMTRVSQGGFDVVHNHSLFHLPAAMAHLLPMPVVATLHVPPFTFLRNAVRQSQHYGSQHLVAVSEHCRRAWSPWAQRVEVIHNGIDLSAWPQTQSKASDCVVWAGRMCKEKAPHLAIDAARRAGKRIVLAGPVYAGDYFDAHVAPRLGEDAVHVGHLNQQELGALVASAQCFVFSSVWEEPFGLVLAEALACGTPVAAFDSGAAREVVAQGCGAICPIGDVEALAVAIGRACQMEPDTCRAHARASFGMGRMAREYEALYERLVLGPLAMSSPQPTAAPLAEVV